MKTFERTALGPLIVLFLLAGCGGAGSSGGGTETREITGTVSSSGTPALKTQTDADCAADTVIATDPSGGTTVAEVDELCNFSLTLEIDRSYVISFSKDGVFVATLLFDSGVGGFTGSDLTITAGDEAIALGQITITGNVAIPEFEPEEQTDEDGDGLNDLEDEDDDNDGVEDEIDGEDCDLDGVEEGGEEEESCEEEGDLARVLEVKPRNDPHPELGEDRVDLDKEVKARISCEVDQTTVTAETFRVESDSDTIACTFEFSGTGSSGNRIKCKHGSQDFLPDTVYTATIDGVQCLDGRGVEPRSWSWLTEEEDEDEGDVEDDLDEEDEAEDDEEDEEDDAEEDDDDADDEEDEGEED